MFLLNNLTGKKKKKPLFLTIPLILMGDRLRSLLSNNFSYCYLEENERLGSIKQASRTVTEIAELRMSLQSGDNERMAHTWL